MSASLTRVVLAALVFVGCAPSPSAPPTPVDQLIAAAPPTGHERALTTFGDAASALDWTRAEALAVTAPQREYAAVLRLFREGRLDEVDAPLSRLEGDSDKDIAARARALRVSLWANWIQIGRRPAAPGEQAFFEALSRAHSVQAWSRSTHAVRQPLRIHSGHMVFVDVAINGMPARLLLDTGADFTVIGSRLAESLGLRSGSRRVTMRGALGNTVETALAVVNLDIGGAHVENHPVLLVESTHLERLKHVVMLPGLIGWNTVRGLRILMDRDARTMDIDRTLARPGEHATFVWIGKPLVRMVSQNGLVMHFVLDTGTVRSNISRDLATEAGLAGGRVGPIAISALGGDGTVQGAVHDNAVLYVGGSCSADFDGPRSLSHSSSLE